MATLTPIKKQDLVDMGLKFISVQVPVFPITVQRTVVMKAHLFDTLEQAKEELSKIPHLIIFDTESVYGENAVQENKKLQIDKLYIRLAENITDRDVKKLLGNLENETDAIYHYDFDLSNFS